MSWTDERVELLKKLWARRPVRQPDRGRTRRHHPQRGHRQGASPGPSGRAKSPVVDCAAAAQAALLAATCCGFRAPRCAATPRCAYDYEVEPEPELIEIPVEQRKTLLELNEKTCHWPVGDPGSAEFFFCGGEAVNDLPYCAYHSRVAYQPLR